MEKIREAGGLQYEEWITIFSLTKVPGWFRSRDLRLLAVNLIENRTDPLLERWKVLFDGQKDCFIIHT